MLFDLHKTCLFRVLVLCVWMSVYSSDISGQSEHSEVVISLVNETQIKGKIVGNADGNILITTPASNDTIALEKILITHLTKSKDNLVFNKGKYHKLMGWNYSTSYSLGVTEIVSLNRQQSFQVYKMRNRSLGLGGGVGFKFHKGKGKSIRRVDYKFADLFVYGKYYLNQNQKRLFIDSKLGYSIPLAKKHFTTGTRTLINNYLTYSSGFMVQPGVGLQFAGRKKLKWGIKLDGYLQEMREWTNEKTSEGVDRKLLYGALFGINFYL